MTIAFNQRPYIKDLIITPQEVKNIFLFGTNLTDDDGCPFPEEMFEFYIRSAQEWLEIELGGLIVGLERTIEAEVHDYYFTDYVAYSFFKLFRYPVTEVNEVSVQFPLSSNILTFDPSWYRADSVGAQLQLVPTQGTFSSILIGQGGNFLPLLYNAQDIPALFRITYKAGFKKGQIPTIFRDIVGAKAAMGPLNIAGDLVAGAGIASKSLSMDGLSQSIGTTASAMNTAYSARILQLQKMIDEQLKHLRNYYVGPQMVVA